MFVHRLGSLRFLRRLPTIPSVRFLSTDVLPYPRIHTPVMLEEVMSQLAPHTGGVYCDLTFGEGGYTKAILDACDCKVVAVDQDPVAYEKALQLADMAPYRNRLFPVLGRFGQVQDLVKRELDWSMPCFDGVVMDIGVSSGQIETASRGFSYKLDGPLDMRMFSRGREAWTEQPYENESYLMHKSISAFEIVNFFPREQLADIIYQYGGDRASRKIANAIVTARQRAPIETTASLATIIQKACPQPQWKRGDDNMLRNSAARTFQALRIYINDELGELKRALDASQRVLKPEGRLVAVTFHSLEDRIVKNFFQHCAGKRSFAESEQAEKTRVAIRQHRRALYEGRQDYARQPFTAKETIIPSFELLTKRVIRPTREEIALNARSRSAKLRAAKRTSADPLAPFSRAAYP